MKDKGFSLVEVMITLLMVTVGMLALGSFYLASIKSERMAQERVSAVHLAEQILEDWQSTNTLPTPDCKVAGVAAGALVLDTTTASCVLNNGIPAPFDILISESPVKAPIPSGHLRHSTGAGAPEMGNLLQDPTNVGSATVSVRTVQVSWTIDGATRNVMLTHITRKP
ncbi:MAG: prepilin-type N-terminal cleavage/methylation domain-containing protein [Ghiorsea sp.]|nr:prepilin-type N-terminal cleavage/methylation domain-containing protein [Ghiorsea sp.]